MVGVIKGPQTKNIDFELELGDIFAVKLTPSNRCGRFKALRERWKTHVPSSRIHAQEIPAQALAELRILSNADFDATSPLTVVLSGDGPLGELFRQKCPIRWGPESARNL